MVNMIKKKNSLTYKAINLKGNEVVQDLLPLRTKVFNVTTS